MKLTYLLMMSLLVGSGGQSRSNALTMWAEIPLIVAEGSAEDALCYYRRLTKTITASSQSAARTASDAGALEYNQLVVRVEDPWINDWGTTNENGWLFNPDARSWPNGSNPFFEMLKEVRLSLKEKISIHFLPQLHQGSYFRWPCYPLSSGDRHKNRTDDCSTVPGFVTDGDLGHLKCGARTPPPPTCNSTLRPAGCPCDKSWNCESNWCEDRKCGGSGRAHYDPKRKAQCVIPSAVWGDREPYAHCCASVIINDTTYGSHTLDYSSQACCNKAESPVICNQAEVNPEGQNLAS